MNKKLVLHLVAFFLIFNALYVFAWDDKVTHRDLSLYATKKSDLDASIMLQDLGFSKGIDEILTFDGNSQEIFKWLLDGASLEDTGNWWNTAVGSARFVNHFHNPLKDWYNAGLTDVLSGESSLLWAQDGANQSKFLEGDRSWKTIRNLS